jgi:predicted amino acid racemase
MKLPTPRLEIYPARISENARSIAALCHQHKISVAAVTKVSCAHPAVVNALAESGVEMLADSRLENLKTIKDIGIPLPRMLLRLPAQDRIEEVVQLADYSLNSSLETIKLLSAEAARAKTIHKVILMVDLGDLREGVWPERVESIAAEIAKLPAVELAGLGCNLACYGGVIPTTEKMQTLVELRDTVRKHTGLALELLSGGNSANLPLLAGNGMPQGINHLRIGEAIQLGRNVLDRSPWPGTRQDTYRIVAQVIELERKPSVPIGERGQDAFGGTPQFEDRGWRYRAICNLGRQDVAIDNLEPEDSRLSILGGSSDHLIVDVENAHHEIKVGSELAFWPGYAALLAASTSPYVAKVVIEG